MSDNFSSKSASDVVDIHALWNDVTVEMTAEQIKAALAQPEGATSIAEALHQHIQNAETYVPEFVPGLLLGLITAMLSAYFSTGSK